MPYIKYTIETGAVSDNDQINAVWDGTASNNDETHAIKMFAENVNTGKWDQVGTADENGTISTYFNAADYVKSGKAEIMVQCTHESSLAHVSEAEANGIATEANVEWDGNSAPENYDFVIPWTTDTQYYAESYQSHYLNMNRWIVDNAEELNINYVLHTGDIVDEYDMTYQWENADEAMSLFEEAGISYGVLAGNHDVAAGNNMYENYYQYFGEDRFASQDTYGGSYKNNKGHYDLLTLGGQDFIFVYMSWDIFDEEIDWMNEVLAKYSDRKAIICLHRYTHVWTQDAEGTSYLDYIGRLLQDEVVAKNSNVMAVLNGHYHGSSYETVKFDDDNDGIKERTVYQICTDYQSGFEGGAEYIKLLYFDLENDKIYINSYSPYYKDYNYFDGAPVNISEDGKSGDSIDAIILDVDFDTDDKEISSNNFQASLLSNKVIDTATVDSNNTASVQWKNLKEETEYSWYAVVTTQETGYIMTPVKSFTTTKKVTSDIIEPGDGNTATNPDGEDVNAGDRTNAYGAIIFLAAAAVITGLIFKKKETVE